MYELIITILLNCGYNVGEAQHFTMSYNVVEKIQSSPDYRNAGGDREFFHYVDIYQGDLEDIVITDDDNPKN